MSISTDFQDATRPPPRMTRLQRTHRKVLVVDGKIGFIGGGIADQWAGNADSPGHWRDNHYRVTRFAAEQTRIFERDRAHCIRINLENYRDRSLTNKPLETAQTPLESQL